MHNIKKKLIIIIPTIAVLLIAIIITILYFTTDLCKSNEELFWKLIHMFEKVKEEYQKKVQELQQENANILNFSNVTDLENISLNHQMLSIPKDQERQFLLNQANISPFLKPL